MHVHINYSLEFFYRNTKLLYLRFKEATLNVRQFDLNKDEAKFYSK